MRKITICKVTDLDERFNKILNLLKVDYEVQFCEENFKNILPIREKKDKDLVVLFSQTFFDLMSFFSYAEIVEILEAGVLLCILDNPEISQIRFNFVDEKNIIVETDFPIFGINLLKAISDLQYRKKHGRPTAVFSERFVNDYWAWQMGEKTVKDILENEDFGFKTKQQFYSLAERYEKTASYISKQQEYAHELVRTPKRGHYNGGIFFEYVSKNKEKIICEETIKELMSILSVNYIDFWREIHRYCISTSFAKIGYCKLTTSMLHTVSLTFVRPDYFCDISFIDRIKVK